MDVNDNVELITQIGDISEIVSELEKTKKRLTESIETFQSSLNKYSENVNTIKEKIQESTNSYQKSGENVVNCITTINDKMGNLSPLIDEIKETLESLTLFFTKDTIKLGEILDKQLVQLDDSTKTIDNIISKNKMIETLRNEISYLKQSLDTKFNSLIDGISKKFEDTKNDLCGVHDKLDMILEYIKEAEEEKQKNKDT